MATDNKSLGKFTLDGIPPAPRGIPQIEVTFDIDANGILQVTAKDKATGRSQNITITASSGLSEAEVEKMRREAEANAEEDRKRKELIEARNNADNVAYSAEKTLRDLGDKVPAEMKTKVEDAVRKVREVKDADDLEVIKKETDGLMQILQEVGSAAYAQEQPASEPDTSADGDPAAGEDTGKTPPDDENVVDGEFKQV